MKSMSEVKVKTAVMLKVCPFCFLGLKFNDGPSSNLHSMDNPTSTGSCPPFEVMLSSDILNEY